jgi:hypothetical protein
MKTMTTMIGLLAGLVLAACQPSGDMGGNTGAEQSAAPAAAPAATMPAAAAEEPMNTVTYSLINEPTWVTLFAGQDLDQFDRVGGANWQIVDDVVEATSGEPGFLVTRGGYGDVRVMAEFWTSPDANSGIFMRCSDGTAISAANCYEVNIFDQRPDQTYRTGAIVDHAEPMAQVDAANQWNTFDIVMEGDHLMVTMNGTVMVDTHDSTHTVGPIAFQWSAGTVRFRNLKLRPL